MAEFSTETIRLVVLTLVAMILSSAVHEWAHAFTAYRLGDDTAARQGRLTLNPLAHIDPIGTLLLPAVGAMMGFIFGYAKPVPITPVRLTRRFKMSTGVALVALAGPVSNLIMAILCGGILKLIIVFGGGQVFRTNELAQMFGALMVVGIWLNVILFLFNFLPVYPLDGSKILEGVLPRRHHGVLELLQRNRLLVMMLVLIIGIRFLRVPMVFLTELIFRTWGLGYGVLQPLLPYI